MNHADVEAFRETLDPYDDFTYERVKGLLDYIAELEDRIGIGKPKLVADPHLSASWHGIRERSDLAECDVCGAVERPDRPVVPWVDPKCPHTRIFAHSHNWLRYELLDIPDSQFWRCGGCRQERHTLTPLEADR